MQDIPDNIIKEASEGNMSAFQSIYDVSSDFVYNLAFRMANNAEDAKEITQDVFVNIYKNLKNFQFRSSFKTWAYRIAVNTAINTCKKRTRESGKLVELTDDIAAETKEQPNEALIKSLLAALNPEQRSCIVLRNIEGLSYQEIADTLKININTVRSRLKRAREALVTQFGKRGGKNEL
ncbi:MAG: sigma-70 family RNA polymerase sigma factor [Candidatus Omnitrophota bacterium]